MDRSIFQIWKLFKTKNNENSKKCNFLFIFAFFLTYSFYFYFLINNKVFCFSNEYKLLQKFEINNMIIYKSNLVGKNLENSLINFKHFYLNFNYDKNYNYFNWYYLEHVIYKNKSFLKHPCLIYKDYENNILILKHYTKNPDTNRNYDHIYTYIRNLDEKTKQLVSSEYSALDINEVIIKTVTNTMYLDQFNHIEHVNNFFQNIKEYKY